MEKSIHFRRPRLAMTLANVALAIVLALGVSPATKAMAEPNGASPSSVELKANISATVNDGSMTSAKEFTFGLFDTDNEGKKTGNAISTVKVKAGKPPY